VTQASLRIKELEEKIKALPTKTGGVVVSEHALLRYLERVKGMDLNAIAAEILDDKSKELIEFAQGNVTLKRPDYRVVVKDHVVVTVNEP
jgi:hypothetical protein